MRILVVGDWHLQVHEEPVARALQIVGHSIARFAWHACFGDPLCRFSGWQLQPQDEFRQENPIMQLQIKVDQPSELSKGKSDFLNLIRWISALVVVIGHTELISRYFIGDRVSDTPQVILYFTYHAHSAVMIFFVLSGYIVGYSTFRKLKTGYDFREYFLDRWSRIYSVLFPAIVLTLFLDRIGQRHNAIYLNDKIIPQGQEYLRLFVNVLALQGIQGKRVQLGSNPALWSIGYEFCFYLIYGFVLFRPGILKNRYIFPVAIGLLFLILGLNVSAYFLLWLYGFIIFYFFHMKGIHLSNIYAIPLIVLLVVANHYIAFRNALDLPEYWQDLLISSIVGLLLLCEFEKTSRTLLSARMVSINGFMADFSYSLYAFHMPVMFFVLSMVPVAFLNSMPFVAISLLLIILCLFASKILYYATEAQRLNYRIAMGRTLKGLHMLVRYKQ